MIKVFERVCPIRIRLRPHPIIEIHVTFVRLEELNILILMSRQQANDQLENYVRHLQKDSESPRAVLARIRKLAKLLHPFYAVCEFEAQG